jgi:hypothetical protein
MSALWGLLLAIPVVAAYLVRARVQRRTVSSLTIFRVLQDQVEVKRRFAVPHGWLSLLMVLAALTALVGSLLETAPPRDVAVLFDHSASMAAGDRMSQASDHLDALLDGLQPRDRVALLDHTGRILVPLTADHEAVREHAATLSPAGSARPGALDVAQAVGEVVLIGDGGVTGQALHLGVGEAAPNHGLVAVGARRTDGLGGVEVQAQVLNASDEDALIPVQIGALREGLFVPAGEQVGLTRTLDDTDEVLVQIEGDDSLQADDLVKVTLAPLTTAKVLLVSERPDGFLASALRVHPRADLRVAEAWTAGDWDLVVYEGIEGPLDGRTASFGVPAAHFGLEGREVKKPELIRWSFDDTALRFVELDTVKVLRAEELTGPGEALLETETGALAMRVEDDLVVGFGLSDTDLPLRLAFVNLVANLVDEAAPVMAPPVFEGVLSADETRLNPVVRGESPVVGSAFSVWRIALVLALLLLLAEAALPLLRRRRARAIKPEVRRAA